MIKNYFSNFFLYFIFTTFFILIKSQRQHNFFPETCKDAREWPLIGTAHIRDYCGRVLLLIFISPKQCTSECNNILNQLNSLYDQFPSVRVMAVLPMNENKINLNLFVQRFSKIRFEIENRDSQVWNWFRANHLDQFIFDRCSRNTAKLLPTTPFSSITYSLQATLSTQPCGSCDYDSTKPAPNWPSLHPPPRNLETRERGQFTRVEGTPNARRSSNNVVPPRNSVFVNNNTSLTSFNKQRTRNSTEKTSQRKVQQTKQQQQIKTTSKPERNINDYNNLIKQKQLELQERERLIREREDRQRQNEEKQRRYWQEQQQKLQKQQQQIYSPTFPPLNQQQKQSGAQNMEKHKTRLPSETTTRSSNYANDDYKNRNYFSRGNERKQQNNHENKILSNSLKYSQLPPSSTPVNQRIQQQKSTINNVEPAPLYPDGSENNNVESSQDYYNYDEILTTELPPQNVQIPKPITTKLEPTQPSSPSSSSLIQQQDNNKNFGFELPCTGFSDESCFQQQTQLRPNEIHRCCRGRILFSDVCVSGKCSNTTTQLCCIQRFLQAKFTCCSDERLATTPIGDHFSRCCFYNFVDSEDICCPREYASEQWRSIHELCLPNVEMDLSEVKVPIPLMGTSLITEFDFGKTDKWRFECRYGAHTRQFSYFEQSASQEEDNDSEEKSKEVNRKKR